MYAKYVVTLSLDALYSAKLSEDMTTDVERYEIHVRSFANHTLASTFTGVATFSEECEDSAERSHDGEVARTRHSNVHLFTIVD